MIAHAMYTTECPLCRKNFYSTGLSSLTINLKHLEIPNLVGGYFMLKKPVCEKCVETMKELLNP